MAIGSYISGDCYVLYTKRYNYYFKYLGSATNGITGFHRVFHYYTSEGTTDREIEVYNSEREWTLKGMSATRLSDEEVLDKILMVVI